MRYKIKLWKIGYVLLLLYWIVISINNIFIDSSTNLFYVAVAVGCGTFILLQLYSLRGSQKDIFKRNISKEGRAFKRAFSFFLCLNIFYLVLSFLGLGTWFNIEGLGYNWHYIFRHDYFIVTLPIAYIFAVAAYEGFWERFEKKHLLYALYVLILAMCIFSNVQISARSLIIAIASILYVQKRNAFNFMLIVLAILVTHVGQSAPLLAGMVLIFILFFPKFFGEILGKNNKIKFFGLVMFVIVCMFIGFEKFYEIAYKDVNAIWRLQYWINDFRVLIKTYGIGVGYGTAYATTSLFSEIFNPNVFKISGYTMEGALFVIAQHSSLVNMFYRMGLIGGFSFLIIHLEILAWFRKLYRECKNKQLKKQEGLLLWGMSNFFYHFVIIVLNPGIESPVFFWGYLIFGGIMVGILFRASKLIAKYDIPKQGDIVND